MKATIVKNDKFETIGFEVLSGTERVYNWGISPSPMSWTKEVSATENAVKIFKLVDLRARISELDRFWSKFVETARTIKGLEDGGYSVNFGENDKEKAQLEEQVKRIIESIA